MAHLEYDFRVVGADAVNKAFASIERRAIQHNRRMGRVFGDTTGRAGRPAVAARSIASEVDKSARDAANAQIREEKRVRAEMARTAKWRQSLQNRHYQQEERLRIRSEQAAIRSRSAMLGQVGKSAGSAVRTVGAIGVGALALGGTFAVSSAISQQMRETKMASSLANQAGNPAMKRELLAESQNIRGFTGEEVLSSMSGFVEKTGDLQAARKIMGEMSTLSLATDTDFRDLGEAAGQAFNVIRDQIKDPIEQMKILNDVMKTLAMQGNMGAVEMKDFATELASIGAATRGYEGDPADLLKTFGAMAQATVARGGAPTAAEASTALVRFGEDLTKKPAQKALRGLGIDIFTDKTRTKRRNPKELIADIMAQTGGDLTKLQDVLNVQSIRAFQGFSPLALEAMDKVRKENPKATKDEINAAGRKAIMDEFERFMPKVDEADFRRRAESRLEDPDLKFKDAMKDFNRVVGGQLLPELTKLVPLFAKLTPSIGKAAEYFGKWLDAFASDPLLTGAETVGALILASVAKDLASAKIGEAIKALLGGGTPSVPGVPGAPGIGGGVLGTVGNVLGIAGLAFGGAYLLGQGIESTDWAKDKRKKEIADEMATADRDNKFREDNPGLFSGADPSFLAAIQQSLDMQAQQQGGASGQASLENSATAQKEAAEKLSAAADKLAAMPPIQLPPGFSMPPNRSPQPTVK